MCLILFAYDKHPIYKFIVAANRDEFYNRPTAPAHFWNDYPDILAGRDLEKMGTWMGVTKSGGFSALTNFRNPSEKTEGKESRGKLVTDALKYKGHLRDYMNQLAKTDSLYPGYNLLAGDKNELYYYSNVGKEMRRVESGIYGVSNHLLDSDWPKVNYGKQQVEKIILENKSDLVESLFVLLSNADVAQDDYLPKTGVSIEMERMLSPLFIKSKGYGTRSSTVLLMSNDEVQYVERVFLSDGTPQTQTFKFQI